MCKEKNLSLLVLVVRFGFPCFHSFLWSFLLLFFNFSAIVGIITTTIGQFQFYSQVSLFERNVIFPIRLKIEFSAVFIDCSSMINLLILGLQDIFNCWFCAPTFPETAVKNWCRFMLDMNLQILLEKLCWQSFFLLSVPNCFHRVCLPTLFAPVWKFTLSLTTSAISGAENSNKSAPTR